MANKLAKQVIAMAMAASLTMGMSLTTLAAEPLPEHIPAAPAEGEELVAQDGSIDVTIVIPSTPDDPATEEPENQATETFGDPVNTLKGDVPTDADDTEFDYTITAEQGSVTVEATENENGENNVEFVTGVTGPEEGNDIIYEENYFDKAENYYEDNELEIEDFLPAPGNEEVTPEELGKLDIPGEEDEARYELITQGATSQFRPLPVFTKPMSDEDKVAEYGNDAYIRIGESAYTYYINWLDAETKSTIAKNADNSYVTDEEGYLLDVNGNRIVKVEKTVNVNGQTYYMHRFDLGKQPINGAYNDNDGDGVWEEDSTQYSGAWEEAAQFVLVDKTTGELITTYLEDYYIKKYAVGAEYVMKDLEDSEKFGEYADNLRAVAQSGYWGTADGIGSLDAMKAELLASGLFTEEELASLTDGVALAATQMAIYYYANAKFGQEFLNTNYDVSGNVSPGTAVPSDKKDEAALMFKVYDYLRNLTPVEAATEVKDIITNENFLKGDMEITVLSKADGHANNSDGDDTNDAYTTNLSFALVVSPTDENGDSMIVKVVNPNTGEVIAQARLAGTAAEGEREDDVFDYDKDTGNVTFKNIILVEGNNTYNITMEGIQNLKDGGVYLFTTEVPEGARPQPSMIGMTSDKNVVNVQSINFSFEVKEEKVVLRERHDDGKEIVYEETTPYTTSYEETTDEAAPAAVVITEENVPLADLPLVEIFDEEVPLADVPLTGDPAVPFMGLSLISALGLIFTGKRRKENR